MTSRRNLLKAGIAGATLNAVGATRAPILGLVSPVDVTVPPEAGILYPTGIRFQAASVGLARMTPQGYDQVLERIAPTARALSLQGAQAIVLMGTSLSFYKGASFNSRAHAAHDDCERLPCGNDEYCSDRGAARGRRQTTGGRHRLR